LLGPAQPDPVPTPGKKLKELILPLKNPGKPTQHFVGNYDWYKANSVVGHNGTDWGVPVGTPLYAVADGVIEWVDTDVDDKGAIKGWGNYIRIWHPDYGFHSFLAHMREQSKLKKGDVIKQGDVVGYTGNTGWSTGPHLHYSVRLAKPDSQYLGTTANTKGYVDPLLFHDWVNAWLVPSSGGSSDTSELEAALKVIADLKATIKQISDIASKAGS
jgi:murein DD-endopeptidase MepM/ murein hydrolase activator NlpD